MLTARTVLIKTEYKTKAMKKELNVLYESTSKVIKVVYQQYRNKVREDNLDKYSSSKRACKQLTIPKNWIKNLKTKDNETKTRNDVINSAKVFCKTLYEEKFDASTTSHSSKNTQCRKITLQDEHEAQKIGFALLARRLTYIFIKPSTLVRCQNNERSAI